MAHNRLATQLSLVVFFLLAVGAIFVLSSSSMIALRQHDSLFYYFNKHLVTLLISLGLLAVGARIPTHKLYDYAPFIFAATWVLLALTLVPHIGIRAQGAGRWIGYGPFRLQSAELLKIGWLIFLASALAQKSRQEWYYHPLFTVLVVPLLSLILLLLQPDFGTALLLCTVSMVLLFFHGLNWRIVLSSIVVGATFACILVVSSPYRFRRILAFLEPEKDPPGYGYQIMESFIALGSGGLGGNGLGAGTAKLFYLPAAHTDFILAIIGEEGGYLATALVILSFFFFFWVGLKIALAQEHPFARMLASGITLLIFFQAMFNIFVVLGLLPTKGITLPLISYGGSSLLTTCFLLGILLKLARSDATKSA